MHLVTLPRLGTFAAWRNAARALAGAGVPERHVTWALEGDAADLFGAGTTPLPKAGGSLNVPRDFVSLARQLCAHRDPGAFALAYRLLVRVAETPRLIRNRADPEMARAEALAKNIRRDMHKMKAFVRFREVGAPDAPRRQFVAWFEPDHRIEELIGSFFTRRFGDMDWVILTPEVEMRFEAGQLTLRAQTNARPDLTDDTEALWRTYYANIFNPARLKVKAMQAEMPKKYWKNLPEADLIPGLIAEAEARVAGMRAAPATPAPVFAARVLAALPDRPAPADLAAAIRAAPAAWGEPSVRGVPGTGPCPAPLMIVGEQPGDREDLAGLPFVGPAGAVLDAALAKAGIDRSGAFLTNAVKHFKFTVRGKRRIHQTPTASEVAHDRWWLQREIAVVQPRLIVALGATAALALTGDGKALMRRRGGIEAGRDGTPVLITLHPAALLRVPDPARTAAFHADLALAAAQVAQTATA